jgi:hypothetical protein
MKFSQQGQMKIRWLSGIFVLLWHCEHPCMPFPGLTALLCNLPVLGRLHERQIGYLRAAIFDNSSFA